MQVVADATYSEPCDVLLLVAAVRATASMSRNLPTSATGFITAHIPHLDDHDSGKPAESLPQSMQLLFDVAVRSSSACSHAEGQQPPCTVHASVAKSAMGLLADLAANDAQARTSLQGRYAVKAWIGALAVLPAVSETTLRETQKIILNIRNFSIYAGTTVREHPFCGADGADVPSDICILCRHAA